MGLCMALAGLLCLRVYVVSLNAQSVTEDGLAALFRDLSFRCIVLLEDIDAAGLMAKWGQDKEEGDGEPKRAQELQKNLGEANLAGSKGLTLSAFLNILDGVASSD